jgi:hypothetical protein
MISMHPTIDHHQHLFSPAVARLISFDETDAATPGRTPREGWAAFQRLPLSDEEFRTIAGNVAPYMQ